ncbi:MAG: hypothetical protein J0H92_19315 [Sphingobacteriales bacterium]|nr:hypothetical protein [Sphingobacteriales bacterium]OJW32071.1 MAG: hypothetical protein BGO54_16795 [Sphingobacteriales bacterium 46-32]
MRYELNRRLVNDKQSLPISEKEYKSILLAKKQLHDCYKLTENYGLVVESYRAFELAKFELELDHMLFSKYAYPDLANAFIKMTTPVTSLLSAFRYFIDTAPHVLGSLGGKELALKFKLKTHEIYDSCFEYRFICALRNHVQHEALPLHNYAIEGYWDTKDPETTDHANSISLEVWKKRLGQSKKFKRSVLDEMPDKVNLVFALRVYLSKLSDLYAFMLSSTTKYATKARMVIDKFKSKYTEETGLSDFGLCVMASDGDQVIAQESVFTDWDDARIKLMEKTKLLKSVHRSYITGKIRKRETD